MISFSGISKRRNFRDWIIIHIRWRLGNLKKTYLGALQQPISIQTLTPMFEWFEWLIQTSAIAMAIAMADVWTCWCLNIGIQTSAADTWNGVANKLVQLYAPGIFKRKKRKKKACSKMRQMNSHTEENISTISSWKSMFPVLKDRAMTKIWKNIKCRNLKNLNKT